VPVLAPRAPLDLAGQHRQPGIHLPPGGGVRRQQPFQLSRRHARETGELGGSITVRGVLMSHPQEQEYEILARARLVYWNEKTIARVIHLRPRE
jgi:hypothetical protein